MTASPAAGVVSSNRGSTVPRELEQFQRAQRMLPLLRSYSDELRQRRVEVKRLKRGQTAKGELAGARARNDAELSSHLRELRRIDAELERLGWYCDDEEPLRFYLRGTHGAPDVMWTPSERELASFEARPDA